MKFFSLIFFAPLFSLASIDVAFLEMRNYQGQVIQLEPGGSFAHVAISYNGQWLHAHPVRGVELVSQRNLERMGFIKSIVSVTKLGSLQESEIARYLGKDYDSEYSWDDDKIYCSELVAKLLDLDPEPMTFDRQLWPERFERLNGQLGISPDDIFRILEQRLTESPEN